MLDQFQQISAKKAWTMYLVPRPSPHHSVPLCYDRSEAPTHEKTLSVPHLDMLYQPFC